MLYCRNSIKLQTLVYDILPSTTAVFSYATEGALFISAQLSTDAVSALRKVWVVIRLWKKPSAQFPSLISLIVSVDVKHRVYLLTGVYITTKFRQSLEEGAGKRCSQCGFRHGFLGTLLLPLHRTLFRCSGGTGLHSGTEGGHVWRDSGCG